MTQKSMARKMRDQEKRNVELAAKAQKQREQEMRNEIASGNNTCWDDLDALHNDCQALLLRHIDLGRELNDKELLSHVTDTGSLVIKIRSLAGDLRQLKGELAQIAKQHDGKTGGVTDPDELMKTFAIFEQYHLFQERHNSVIMPTVYHILEQIDAAEKKLLAAHKAAADAAGATDPNVITDVAFTEAAA